MLALLGAGTAPAAAASDPAKPPPFPRGFLWGTAISAFQTETGRGRDLDRRTDWWAWSHDPAEIAARHVSGDRPERGPGHWARYREDVDLAARGLGANAYRISIEWSRIFPRSTAGVRTGTRITRADLRRLDRLADHRALRHYRGELAYARRRGLTPFVTVNHFTLPSWLHDPIATRDALARRGPDDPLPAGLKRSGWLDPGIVSEFRKYAAYLAWKLGGQTDLWNPLNEPQVVATSGYVNIPGAFAGWFPPGAYSFAAVIAVLQHLERANAAAYDAIRRWDRRDAVGHDRVRARVGLVQNMVAFTPADPASARDVAGTRHAEYVFDRLFLEAAINGWRDANANGALDPGERKRSRAGKADFVGVNYYFRGRVTGLGAALTPRLPVLDFLPATSYRTPQNPTAAPCPTTCSDFGWELYPEGLAQVLRIAGSYQRPVYISETGIADAADRLRAAFLVRHLQVLRAAMRARVADVRGLFHWSLMDNFEWAAGFSERFGFYAYDRVTLTRRARPSAAVFRRIAQGNRLPADLVRRYGLR